MSSERPLESLPRRRFRPATSALIALAAAVILTGCYRINVSIEVDDDGSGEASFLMAVDPGAFESLMGPMAEFGDEGEFSRDELCSPEALAESFGEVTDDMTVEPYDEDGYCGEIRTVSFDADEGVGSALSDMSADDGSFVLEELPDGGWRFEANDVSAAPTDEGLDDEFVDAEMMEMLLGDAEFTFEVTLPGKPVDHNATSVDGNTFTWDLDIFDPVANLYAETEPGDPGGSSSSWIWIVVVVVAIAVAGAVAFVLLRRRSEPDGGPGDTGTGGTPGGDTLPPPPAPAGAPPAAPAAPPTSTAPPFAPPPAPPAAPPADPPVG